MVHEADTVEESEDGGEDLTLFQGKHPAIFGRVHYDSKTIYLSAGIGRENLRYTLFHEVGHIIAWMTGDANNETVANYFLRLLQDLQTPLIDQVLGRLVEFPPDLLDAVED
jgi:hypothetical protein